MELSGTAAIPSLGCHVEFEGGERHRPTHGVPQFPNTNLSSPKRPETNLTTGKLLYNWVRCTEISNDDRGGP